MTSLNDMERQWENHKLDAHLDREDRRSGLVRVCPLCNAEGSLEHVRYEYVITNRARQEGYKAEIMYCESCGEEVYFADDGDSGKVVKPVDQWKETRP